MDFGQETNSQASSLERERREERGKREGEEMGRREGEVIELEEREREIDD